MEAGNEVITGRLRKNLDQFNLTIRQAYSLSLSLGVVGFDPDQSVPIETLLVQADNQMYIEKQRKKNFKKTGLKVEF
jgi:GGDEF domain-containing protein